MNHAPYFPQLKRRLWIGTLAFDAALLGVTAMRWPDLMFYAVFGVGLGVFYLWSLLFNADHPKGRGAQLAFSLIRMMLLAYIIVGVAGHGLAEFTLVICGLLSYKVILTVEYVRQALPGFRWLSGKRPPSPDSIVSESSPQPVSKA